MSRIKGERGIDTVEPPVEEHLKRGESAGRAELHSTRPSKQEPETRPVDMHLYVRTRHGEGFVVNAYKIKKGHVLGVRMDTGAKISLDPKTDMHETFRYRGLHPDF